jgi:hypothetical protein
MTQLIGTFFSSRTVFSNFFAHVPLLALKNNHRSSYLAHVNTECPENRYKKLKIYISEQSLGSYKCIPIAYVKINCMI